MNPKSFCPTFGVHFKMTHPLDGKDIISWVVESCFFSRCYIFDF